jgi:3-oxoacyl-[acyl-carrier-protein] synthase II
MDNNKSVAVTGIAVFTSIGCNRVDFWNSLITGKSGIIKIQAFDPQGHKSRIGTEILSYEPEEYVDRKVSCKMARVSQLASSAAIESVKDALGDLSPNHQH